MSEMEDKRLNLLQGQSLLMVYISILTSVQKLNRKYLWKMVLVNNLKATQSKYCFKSSILTIEDPATIAS